MWSKKPDEVTQNSIENVQCLECTVMLSSIGAETGKAEEKLISIIAMHIFEEKVQGPKNKIYIMVVVNIHILVVHLDILDLDCESFPEIEKKNTISPDQSSLVG